MDETQIKGGATMWARQTIDSEIFVDKPDKWFKIWFYLVNRVSHQDTKNYKRGECFIQYEWIGEKTKASPDQIKKCIAWLKETGAVSTARSTRGVKVFLPKYSHYQTLDNYYCEVKAPHEAPEKHQRSTREALRYNKNDKNDKNILSADADEENFSQISYIQKMRKDKQPHIRLIGWYFEKRGSEFPDKQTVLTEIKRWAKDASFIVKYGPDKIASTHKFVESKFPEEWNLSTIRKYISEK